MPRKIPPHETVNKSFYLKVPDRTHELTIIVLALTALAANLMQSMARGAQDGEQATVFCLMGNVTAGM